MAKAEWGTKRSCPKCGNRFYDLTKEEPVTCISCSYAWYPEPVLKSKQPIPFEVSPDDEVDLGGDDDLGVDTADDKDDN
jgi:hypothetical protein